MTRPFEFSSHTPRSGEPPPLFSSSNVQKVLGHSLTLGQMAESNWSLCCLDVALKTGLFFLGGWTYEWINPINYVLCIMTKSVPLLRVATDTRDSAGNSEFLVAIEKQGHFIVKWIQWFVICKLRDHCKLAPKWIFTDSIQHYITYDLCSMKKVITPLRRTIGRVGNSRHKISSCTSIQKWAELYLNTEVYFFSYWHCSPMGFCDDQ